jgi:hypothetical protein
MGIWMAVVLAAAVFPPEDDRLPRSLQAEDDWAAVDGVAAARLGVWTGRGFDFKATRTDSTQAISKQQALFSASLLGGVQFYEHVVVLGTFEEDVASKITAQVGGAYFGWREHPKQHYGKGVPDEVMIYGGILVGRLTVHESNFGAFDRGLGFGGGIALGWTLSTHVTLQLFGEYRYLKFDYQRDVLSGDKSIGGSTGWFGLGFDYRF